MVDNQHRKILGYRELGEKEIALMNKIKTKGAELGELVALMQDMGADERWLEIGKTDLQTGLMALTRSVAKPGLF